MPRSRRAKKKRTRGSSGPGTRKSRELLRSLSTSDLLSSSSTSTPMSPRSSSARGLSRSSSTSKSFHDSSTDSLYKTPEKQFEPNNPNAPKKGLYADQYKHVMKNLDESMNLEPLGASKSLNGTLYKVISNKTPKFILKLSQDDKGGYHTDNLAYEFLVGMYLNAQRMYFPCFLKTYSLLEFKFLESGHNTKQLLYRLFTQRDLLTQTNYDEKFKFILNNITSHSKINIADTCNNKSNYGVLIDYIEGDTLYNIKQKHNKQFQDTDFYAILFQIYAVLNALEGDYQHRDLHENNVMVYTFPNENEILFTYTILDENNEEKYVSFRSKYLAKIIDYGRGIIPDTKPMLQHYEDLVARVNNTKNFFQMNNSGYSDYMDALHNLDETLYELKTCGFHHITFDTDDFRLFPGARSLSYIVSTLDGLLTSQKQTKKNNTSSLMEIMVDARPNVEKRKRINVKNIKDKHLKELLYEQNKSYLDTVKRTLFHES